MSENKTVYLQPTGLFAIDAAIGNVLRSIMGDPDIAWKQIRILAYTTTDAEIIKVTKDHSTKTKEHLQLLEAPRNITFSYDVGKADKRTKYLTERNEELYQLIMGLLGTRGYLKKVSKDVASNTASSAQLFESR